MKKEKRTIFLNTHLLDEAERICDRVGILKTKLIAVGTPETLRRSLWGKKTMVELESVNEGIIAAVKKAAFGDVAAEGNKLVIRVNDPLKDNPQIVDAIESVGGRVQFVTEVSQTLEDVYLKLVRS